MNVSYEELKLTLELGTQNVDICNQNTTKYHMRDNIYQNSKDP